MYCSIIIGWTLLQTSKYTFVIMFAYQIDGLDKGNRRNCDYFFLFCFVFVHFSPTVELNYDCVHLPINGKIDALFTNRLICVFHFFTAFSLIRFFHFQLFYLCFVISLWAVGKSRILLVNLIYLTSYPFQFSKERRRIEKE